MERRQAKWVAENEAKKTNRIDDSDKHKVPDMNRNQTMAKGSAADEQKAKELAHGKEEAEDDDGTYESSGSEEEMVKTRRRLQSIDLGPGSMMDDLDVISTDDHVTLTTETDVDAPLQIIDVENEVETPPSTVDTKEMDTPLYLMM